MEIDHKDIIPAVNKYLFGVRKDLVGCRENDSQAIEKLFEKDRHDLIERIRDGYSKRHSDMTRNREEFASDIKLLMQRNIREYYSELSAYVQSCNTNHVRNDTVELQELTEESQDSEPFSNLRSEVSDDLLKEWEEDSGDVSAISDSEERMLLGEEEETENP